MPPHRDNSCCVEDGALPFAGSESGRFDSSTARRRLCQAWVECQGGGQAEVDGAQASTNAGKGSRNHRVAAKGNLVERPEVVISISILFK